MTMAEPRGVLQKGDALLIVDMQVDFCPGGALPIEQGDVVVPIVNQWIDGATAASVPIVASRDWHPRQHVSFREFGGQWPVHCVQDTPGARFHPALRLPDDVILVSKGVRFDRDQYSAFDETGLAVELRRQGVRRVWVCGLAQDVCVRATALDAVRQGFVVHLIADATRAVTRAGGDAAIAEMKEAGVGL